MASFTGSMVAKPLWIHSCLLVHLGFPCSYVHMSSIVRFYSDYYKLNSVFFKIQRNVPIYNYCKENMTSTEQKWPHRQEGSFNNSTFKQWPTIVWEKLNCAY